HRRGTEPAPRHGEEPAAERPPVPLARAGQRGRGPGLPLLKADTNRDSAGRAPRTGAHGPSRSEEKRRASPRWEGRRFICSVTRAPHRRLVHVAVLSPGLPQLVQVLHSARLSQSHRAFTVIPLFLLV